MRIPPFLDLFDHEATPSWRSRAFWFGARLSMLIIGFVMALYALLALKLIAMVFYAVAPADWARQFALMLDDNVGSGWINFHETVVFIVCIFIGENVARAALDIAALRPFADDNAKRFMRAAVGAAALVAAIILMRIAERIYALPPIDSGVAIILFGILASVCFASLSLAFRQGAALKKEQDLTV